MGRGWVIVYLNIYLSESGVMLFLQVNDLAKIFLGKEDGIIERGWGKKG